MLPCLIFEDDHLLVVNKPPGLNTHAPGPYAGEGLYDWLRHREPRWANLAIIHRLDKETSGVIVFAKTQAANRSLTEQFSGRAVRKKYCLLTDRPVPKGEFVVKTALVRAGEKYLSRPVHAGAAVAETRFRFSGRSGETAGMRPVASGQWPVPDGSKGAVGVGGYLRVEAEPLTGRTHQIRVHAAERGFPVLGDTLYGGTTARRVHLHAAELTLKHPVTGEQRTFHAAPEFEADPRLLLRAALLEVEETNAYGVMQGASDGWPGWEVERVGDYLLSQSEQPLDAAQDTRLEELAEQFSARGVYHKPLIRLGRRMSASAPALALVQGQPAPHWFTIHENGLQFELSFGEGYSVGLFLDQRDNRRRLLTGHVAAGFSLRETEARPAPIPRSAPLQVLNTFAYTCGFSVCAARGGGRTTSIDLSTKYLEWGKRNFALNNIPTVQHEFICGDTFDWLRRLAKKRRLFDVILLDPPTFSQSKESGAFRAEKDYGKLVRAALPLLTGGGVLFASTNAAGWAPDEFMSSVETAIRALNRRIAQQHYVPQPPDFPVSRAEPAYLKTVWLRIE